MEETYFYRFQPQQGFGIQKVYTADRRIDEIYTIEENDTVAIAEGYHPLAAAPGYDMYYLWTMTGANNRGLISSKDPDHAWVKCARSRFSGSGTSISGGSRQSPSTGPRTTRCCWTGI